MLISSCVAALKHIRHLFSSGMADSSHGNECYERRNLYSHKPRNRRPSMLHRVVKRQMERAGKGQSPYCGLGERKGPSQLRTGRSEQFSKGLFLEVSPSCP